MALERAGRIARQRGLPAGDGRWMAERDAIYEEIMEKGWNPEKNSFVQYYGSDALDASLLTDAAGQVRRPHRPALALHPRPHPARN